MIYSVHFWYRKFNSRKRPSKFESIVFASDKQRVRQLIDEMISGLPIEIDESISIVGSEDQTLEEIYNERSVLRGISPEEGFIYLKAYHLKNIRKYAGF